MGRRRCAVCVVCSGTRPSLTSDVTLKLVTFLACSLTPVMDARNFAELKMPLSNIKRCAVTLMLFEKYLNCKSDCCFHFRTIRSVTRIYQTEHWTRTFLLDLWQKLQQTTCRSVSHRKCSWKALQCDLSV